MGPQCLQGHAGATVAVDLKSACSLIVCALAIVPVRVHEFMGPCVQGIWPLWMFEGYIDPVAVCEC